MSKKVKLTKAQLETLKLISEEPRVISNTYKPVKKLLALRMVTFKQGTWSVTYSITDTGKEYLADET